MSQHQCHLIVLLSAFGAASASPRATLGHVLLVSRGEATIHSDHVTLEIEINAEDFLHSPPMRSDSLGSSFSESLGEWLSQRGTKLSETIVLRDGRGRCLSASPYTLQAPPDFSTARLTLQDMRRMRIRYRADYQMPTPTRYVSFQVVPGQDASAVAWQLACVVRGADQSDARTIRLTSRGNVETVKVIHTPGGIAVETRDADAAMNCAGRISDGLCVDIRIQEDGVHARIEMPLPLLSTWVTLPTTDGEYLTVTEQQQARDALADTLDNSLVVYAAAVKLPAESLTFSWIPLDARTDTSSELGDVSVWNGRLRVDLLYPTHEIPTSLDLHWKLFNAVALTARAFLRCGNAVTEHEFSTYAAHYHWLLAR